LNSHASSAAARLDIFESRIRPGNSCSQQITPDDAVEAAGEQMSEPQLDEPVSLVPIPIATPPPNPPETTVLGQNPNPIPAVLSPKSLLAEAMTVYGTLEDKSSATKKEMVLYVQGATLYYTNTAFCSIQEVENKFYDNFHNWNEEDFSIAKSYLVSIRDKLLDLGVKIRKEARINISLALAGHLAAMKKTNLNLARLKPSSADSHHSTVHTSHRAQRNGNNSERPETQDPCKYHVRLIYPKLV
jgi:hypothetical protein